MGSKDLRSVLSTACSLGNNRSITESCTSRVNREPGPGWSFIEVIRFPGCRRVTRSWFLNIRSWGGRGAVNIFSTKFAWLMVVWFYFNMFLFSPTTIGRTKINGNCGIAKIRDEKLVGNGRGGINTFFYSCCFVWIAPGVRQKRNEKEYELKGGE